MYVVRHEAPTQQRKTVELGIFSQQVEVSDAVGIIGQNDLSGVATLRNMMGNVHDDDARQAGHWKKISEMIQPTEKVLIVFGLLWLPDSHTGIRTGVRPVCPQVIPG
jgi:hypothetical protein